MQDAGWDIIVILLNSFCLAGTAGLDLGPEKVIISQARVPQWI